jgi:enoyl-CoA hydratase
MSTRVDLSGAISVISMDEPRGNALSFETLDALRGALDEAESSGARAVVLASAARVFCVGLDLRACARYSASELARYVDAFEDFFERVFTFPAPLVAAVNGHAIAGGAVLALACDARVMGTEAALALNEVELGIPFPSMAFAIARAAVPSASHVDALMLGRRFEAAEAVTRHIAAEAAPADEVRARAVRRAEDFAARGHAATIAIKRALRAEALSRARQDAAASRAAFVEAFLAPEAQERIKPLVAKLEKKTPST